MRIELRVPVNRVEGDLDIEITIENNKIIDAKSIGTLYRGFENILKGRDPMDALVITPRVCGICSVSHLLASTKALENAYNITPPMQAIRLRNLSIMAENFQSDLRQVYLMFMPDFTNSIYQNEDFFELANKLYAPFKGEFSKKVLDVTKDILKVIAYIGGQWPHTSHMVPGGLSVVSDDLEILRIKYLIEKFQMWYEKEVLNNTFEEFEKVDSYDKLNNFIQNNPNSQISIFTNIAKKTNLFEIGKSGYGFINYPSIDTKNDSKIKASYFDKEFHSLDINEITEDITYAWYKGDNENPMFEETIPDIDKENGYSFAKAPRYKEKVAQTGPLGEELVLGNKLFLDLYKKFGDSVYVRELARFLRPLRYIKWMKEEIENIIKNIKEATYIKPQILKNARGVGLSHAARGALGHWIEIENYKIKRYQIIAPTTWNGSPMDKFKQQGPWEKALIGTEIKDIENPIEMGHIIRSFDPCLVCTVHYLDKNMKVRV